MKLISIKKEPNWALLICNKAFIAIKKYYGMYICTAGRGADSLIPPNGVMIIPMTEEYVDKCNEMHFAVRRFYDQNAERGFLGTVAIKDGNVVGFACGFCGMPNDWNYEVKDSCFYIKYVYVAPDSRGKHYARYLMWQLIHLSERENIYLRVRKNNPSAIHTYESMGFKKIYLKKSIYLRPIKKAVDYSFHAY